MILASALRFVPETHPPARRRSGGLADTLYVFRQLLGEPRFVGCMLANGFAFAAMFAYIAGSPFVLQDLYSLSPVQFSAVFAVNAIGIIAAGQISSRLIASVGARAILGAGLTIGASGGIVLLAVVLLGGIGLWGILPAFFLIVSSVGVVFPSGVAIALEGHASRAGSASALLGLAQFATGAISAPLVGIAGNSSALPTAIVIVTCNLAAVAAFWLLIRPQTT
jgi:MFS transporter, DHA1 family, multidrug resistance protein